MTTIITGSSGGSRMDWTPIILLGALGVGAYFLWDKIKGIWSGATKAVTAINKSVPVTPVVYESKTGKELIPSFNPLAYLMNPFEQYNFWKTTFDNFMGNLFGNKETQRPLTYYERMTPDQRLMADIPVAWVERAYKQPKGIEILKETVLTGKVTPRPLQTQTQASRQITEIITGKKETVKETQERIINAGKAQINPALKKLMGL